MADGNDDWKAGLPDDLKADPSLASFKDVAALAKSYSETKKMVGASIRPPGPDAGPEARKEYLTKVLATAPELVVADDDEALYKRLGRPEKPEEYTVDDATAAAIDLEQARAQAKAAGLTKKQFEALAKQTAEARSAAKAAAEKEHAALKQEWGFAHSDRVLAATAAARKMGLPDTTVAAIAAGQVSAQELRFFYMASKVAGVDAKEITKERDGNGDQGRVSPDEAKAQLAEIRSLPEYWNANLNPARHEILKAKVFKLTGMAFPE